MLEVHVIYHLKIVIGIMIVLYVNVVEVHLLAEVFLLKDRIFFVRIVVNESNTIQQKIMVLMVVNVVLLVIIRKKIKTKILYSFFIQRAFVMKTKKKKYEQLVFSLFFLNDKQTIQFIWAFFFRLIPLKQNEISKSSFLPFYSFFLS